MSHFLDARRGRPSQDWHIITSGFVSAPGSQWVRLFFALNYALLVVVLGNLFVAMVVKTYIEAWEKADQTEPESSVEPPDVDDDDEAPETLIFRQS